MNLGEQLCLTCGLCCDGTLFDNVRLGSQDSIEDLKGEGLPVRTSRSKAPIVFLRQPCAALCADRTCRVYKQRPGQCRAFECGVYKETMAGRMERDQALKWIKRAKRQGMAVRKGLEQLGDTDATRSLNDRFRRVQKRLEKEGATAEDAEIVAKLSLAMHRLHLLAHERFYTRPETALL